MFQSISLLSKNAYLYSTIPTTIKPLKSPFIMQQKEFTATPKDFRTPIKTSLISGKKNWNKSQKKGKNISRTSLGACIEYIKENISDFNEAFNELEAYIPPETNLSTTLYCIIGYDIGVVSDGDAYLNLGHPLYHENKRELLYFALHELHHVAYTSYNPTFSFDEIKTTGDLSRIIRYSTHLEGLAVHSAWDRRRRENGYTHRDYITLNDPYKMSQLIPRFFELLNRYTGEPVRDLVEDDWDVLELMSDADRLWYVVGAWMAESIDQGLGREALNMTIVEGSEAFFKLYKNHKSKNRNNP